MSKKITKPAQTWNKSLPKPDKKIRHFNQPSGSFQGKIILNDQTWVDYDYGVYPPNLALRTSQQKEKPISTAELNQFSVGKYPTLRKIVKEIPKTANAKDMDLYLIRDMEESLIWKNDGFEFSN